MKKSGVDVAVFSNVSFLLLLVLVVCVFLVVVVVFVLVVSFLKAFATLKIVFMLLIMGPVCFMIGIASFTTPRVFWVLVSIPLKVTPLLFSFAKIPGLLALLNRPMPLPRPKTDGEVKELVR